MKRLSLIFTILIIIKYIFAIQVLGTQSGTWSPENNPYQIIGDVTIPSGQSLTIQPGVLVQAMGNYQIIAQGHIIANGSQADSIKFMSGQADVNALWKGIRLENTSIQSQFSFCRIELCQYGINSINSPVSITYCHFNRNQKGIQAYGIGSTNPASVTISNNLIELSQHNGILVAQNSNTTITYNEIRFNGLTTQYYGAIQLSNQSTGGSNSPLIAYNHIHHNHKQGIIAWDIVSANAIQPNVHDNLVEYNLTGIYFRHASGNLYNNIVRYNFIAGNMNSGAGFMISGATAAPYIAENQIYGNYTGFYLTENAQPIIGNPAINHPYAYGMNDIHDNIDANNVCHTIYCYQYSNPNLTIYAQNCYWDYSTAPQIASTIQDHNDDPALPTIVFDPWLNHILPVLLTGMVTYNGALNLTNPKLQLVSATSGLVINQWDITLNQPFQFPVPHDSTVYIVAFASINNTSVRIYAAFGGIVNPTATQIIADVQFNVGELTISEEWIWHYQKVGNPVTINGIVCYPLKKGIFVYAPHQILWLYHSGDYHYLKAYSYLVNDYYQTSVLDGAGLIWTKTNNLSNSNTWQQVWFVSDNLYTMVNADFYFFNFNDQGENCSVVPQIRLYNSQSIPVAQIYLQNTTHYYTFQYENNLLAEELHIVPISVETDGNYFPLVAGNLWKIYRINTESNPFGLIYICTDSLLLNWQPPSPPHSQSFQYRIYKDGVLIHTQPSFQNSAILPLPNDGMQHAYYVTTFYADVMESQPTNTVYITTTDNMDSTLSPEVLSISPNPFIPRLHSLLIHHNFKINDQAWLSIYNIKGQLVWKEKLYPTKSTFYWNGRDSSSRPVSSGLYLIRISTNKGLIKTKRFTLIN